MTLIRLVYFIAAVETAKRKKRETGTSMQPSTPSSLHSLHQSDPVFNCLFRVLIKFVFILQNLSQDEQAMSDLRSVPVNHNSKQCVSNEEEYHPSPNRTPD